MTGAGRISREGILAGLSLGAAACLLGVIAGYSPGVAVAVSLGVAFALIAFNDLALGVALFLYVSFFALVPGSKPDALAWIVLGLSWLAILATRGTRDLDFPAKHPWLTLLLILLVGWAALSAVWAEDLGQVLGVVWRWAVSAALVLITFTAVRSRRDVGWILVAFVLGIITAAVTGLIAPPEDAGGRLASYILDPNILGAGLIAGLAFSCALSAIYRSPLVRLAAITLGGFCAFAMLLTASRGALISTAVCLIAAILLSGRWRFPVLVGGVALVVLAVGYYTTFASPETRDRLLEPTEGQARIEEGRTTIWQVAWRAFDDRPVVGVGAGNFQTASRHYLLQPGVLARTDQIIDQPKVVHNAYLEIAAELGVVGFSLFMAILIGCLRCAVQAAREFARQGDQSMQVVALSSAIAMLGIMTANFFVSDEYGRLLWTVLALGPPLLSVARMQARERTPAA